MIARVSKSVIQGAVSVPASKSMMQRACAAALLKRGRSVIENAGGSKDDEAALGIIQQLGAKVTRHGDIIEIESEGVHPLSDTINCGESGLSCRMFSPIVAMSDKQIRIEGRGSLVKRPMKFFEEIFPELNVSCTSNDGKLPMVVKGPIRPKDICIDGSLSSQFLTGLLMAYSGMDANDVRIDVASLSSKPYVDLTLEILEAFELKVPVNRDYKTFLFKKGKVNDKSHDSRYRVEGDWSSASFLLVAGALFGSVEIDDIKMESKQSDRLILEALQNCGAIVENREGKIYVERKELKAFEFDAWDCPDLFPPLVALASYCKGKTIIRGVERLYHKESNRAESLKSEFERCGAGIEIKGNYMMIEGRRQLKGCVVDSYNDHRIAMALGVAGLGAEGDMLINGAESVSKSYPGFWEDLMKVGGRIRFENVGVGS